MEEQDESSNAAGANLELTEREAEPCITPNISVPLRPNNPETYVIPNTSEPYVIPNTSEPSRLNNPHQHVHTGPENNPHQSHTYEYPSLPTPHHYEYPSVGQARSTNARKDPEENKRGKTGFGVEDDNYTPLVRLPQRDSEHEDSAYTSLINDQTKKGNTSQETGKSDQLINPEEDNYTPLARSLSHDKEREDNGYTSLIDVQKRKENNQEDG